MADKNSKRVREWDSKDTDVSKRAKVDDSPQAPKIVEQKQHSYSWRSDVGDLSFSMHHMDTALRAALDNVPCLTREALLKLVPNWDSSIHLLHARLVPLRPDAEPKTARSVHVADTGEWLGFGAVVTVEDLARFADIVAEVKCDIAETVFDADKPEDTKTETPVYLQTSVEHDAAIWQLCLDMVCISCVCLCLHVCI